MIKIGQATKKLPEDNKKLGTDSLDLLSSIRKYKDTGLWIPVKLRFNGVRRNSYLYAVFIRRGLKLQMRSIKNRLYVKINSIGIKEKKIATTKKISFIA